MIKSKPLSMGSLQGLRVIELGQLIAAPFCGQLLADHGAEVIKVDHPKFDNIWMQNVFPKLSATPGKVNWPGPGLGAHNDEIYRGLM